MEKNTDEDTRTLDPCSFLSVQMGVPCVPYLNRFLSIGDNVYPAAEAFQHAKRYLLIHHIVFGQKNMPT